MQQLTEMDEKRQEFVPKEEASVLPKYLDNVDAELEGHLVAIPVVQDAEFKAETIEKKEILDFGDEAFLLYGVLTPSECRHIMTSGEDRGFQDILGVKESYRNCKRIMIQSDELSSLLWSRIEPYLGPLEIQGDPHDVHIHGIESLIKGSWQPYGLNNIFRLCRYYPGGHFAPHFDGHFVQSARERSMKTLMLYLNGDFDRGTTNFVNENQTLYMDESGKYCAEEKNIQYRVKPAEGMAILFNHHRLHEGGALGSGVKYILRTDVMYRKSTYGAEVDPREEEALQLVQEAERLEARRENMEAMAMYRKAFKLSPSLAKAYGN